MKKVLAVLLALVMVFVFAACGGKAETPSLEEPVTLQTEAPTEEAAQAPEEAPVSNGEDAPAEAVPTTGTPLGWPDNAYTRLVPTPEAGGKVLAANEIGALFSVELEWTMEQGLVYAQQLADAGFGEDCAEKYEAYGYIDRTANGVNVQLLDLFGVASISIMETEE